MAKQTYEEFCENNVIVVESCFGVKSYVKPTREDHEYITNKKPINIGQLIKDVEIYT
jgi:hypothetical protein